MTTRALWAIAAATLLVLTGPHGTLSAGSPAADAAQASAPGPLAAGSVAEAALRGGERHAYAIQLSAGDFLHVIVEQRGVDVLVRLVAPDGSGLITADSPNSSAGPERIAWVAAASGTYQVDVSNPAPASDASAGRYVLRVASQRPATPADVSHADAERLFNEAFSGPSNTAATRDAALVRYGRALDIFATLGLSYEEGLCLFNVGILHMRAGQTRQAVPYLERAQMRFDRATDPMYASVVNALGGALDIVGDPESAMAHYREALATFVAAGDRAREAVVRNNIGKLYADMADWPRALEEYRQALPLFRQLGDRRREGLALYNIGASYTTSGDVARALEYLEQSLTIRRAIGDLAGEADALTLLGFAEDSRGDHGAALTHYEQAIPIRQKVGDRRSEGNTFMFAGSAYLAAGDAARGIEYLRRAVDLRGDSGEKRGHALALKNLAVAYASIGRHEQALTLATEAVALFRSLGDRRGLGLALPVAGRAQQQLGRMDEAMASMREALAAIEDVRGRVSSPELRAAYYGRSQDTYTFAIDLLMQLHLNRPGSGFDAMALQTSERARARSLLDLLAESGGELRRGVDASLVEREHQLARLLDAKANRLIALQTGAPSPEADALARETRTLEAEYEEIRARIRAASPQYSALTQPRPLDVNAIRQEVLDEDTTLVEYSLGDTSGFVWVLDRKGLHSYRLAPRAEIERAAREAYELVTARGVSPSRESEQERARRIADADAALPAALRRVTDLVLAPIREFPETPRLLVVPDGALQYLPFEMLPIPGSGAEGARPMIAAFEIVTQPSASTLSVHRAQLAGRPRPSAGVAIFADPVFDVSDPRVRAKAPTVARTDVDGDQARLLTQLAEPASGDVAARIARLRFTDDEARAILAVAGGRQNLAAIGFAATKAAAVDPSLGSYQYLHFATHGLLDAERPSLSAIALSLVDDEGMPREGFLRAHELYNLNLSADLVVLSACQTGLGKEIRGEGLVGLTRAFMYAGAARVIVSLWNVSDRATSDLMGRLYREMLQGDRTPAASLRAAQLALRADPRWQHPYYWAAFVLQGDWN